MSEVDSVLSILSEVALGEYEVALGEYEVALHEYEVALHENKAMLFDWVLSRI